MTNPLPTGAVVQFVAPSPPAVTMPPLQTEVLVVPTQGIQGIQGIQGPPGLWYNGVPNVLPATSGTHLTTQGGNTLDDGSGNVTINGGTLQGVTIGSTTPATSITAGTLATSQSVTLGGTQKPWLNQTGTFTGNISGSGAGQINVLSFADQIVGNTNYITGLTVFDNVLSPAVGPRLGIQGQVTVTSVGTNTIAQAQYVGILGRTQTGANLGGTTGSPIGEFWGGWFQGTTTGGTHHYSVLGVEIDLSVQSDVQLKVGLRVQTTSTDTTQGTVDDVAVQVIKGTGTVPWNNGIQFGTNQSTNPATTSQAWPFSSGSTIIGTSAAGNGLPANIGIDFSNVTFSGPALKTGPASISMKPMASAPAAVAGAGQIYVASDGSIHYLNPSGTDTQLAPVPPPPVYDNSATSAQKTSVSGGTAMTMSFTAAANAAVIVGIYATPGTTGPQGGTTATVTFGGQTMTSAGSVYAANNTANAWIWVFTLNNQSGSGAQTLSVTLSNTFTGYIEVQSYTQVRAIGALQLAYGTSTSPRLTATAAISNDVVWQGFVADGIPSSGYSSVSGNIRQTGSGAPGFVSGDITGSFFPQISATITSANPWCVAALDLT